jgi:thiol-disulfide isomerase/thioredoxin
MSGRVLTAVVALGALALGAGLAWWLGGPGATPPPPEPQAIPGLEQPAVPEQRPAFALPDLDGRIREAREWDGKVLVVNFWATWCPPCRKEMPMFKELQARYGPEGLQFVGIAIDDPGPVADFVDSLGINYPILLGGEDAIEASVAYGNALGALPYTVIADRGGRIVLAKRGELTRDEALEAIRPLL